MNGIFQSLLAILSGMFLSLAIANPLFTNGFMPLAPVALVPLYIALRNSRNYGDAMRNAAIQALASHLLSSYHLMFFRDFAIFTLGASALGTAGVAALFGAIYFFPLQRAVEFIETATECAPARFDAAQRAFRLPLDFSAHGLYPLHFALAYTLYDWYKAEGIGFLAYPWGTLPCAASGFTLIAQTADLCGVWGLSFLFSLLPAVIGEGIIQIGRKTSSAALLCTCRLCMALLLSAAIYGAVKFSCVPKPTKTLTAVIVQQNADPWVSDEAANLLESERLTTKEIGALKEAGGSADVVIWSEGVLSRPFPNAEGRYFAVPEGRPLIPFIRKTGVPFIIGGCANDGEEDGASFCNAALLFGPSGRYLGYYGKLHLVPFAEVVPGVEYKWVRSLMQSVVGFSSGWQAGKRYTYFDIPAHKTQYGTESIDALERPVRKAESARVSLPVCFDDAFASVCRPLFLNGSEVFFNITDDSWSLTESAERQHLCLARYRAIEYRTAMLRATNSGVSCVIDSRGEMLSALPLFKAVAQSVNVPIYERKMTVYALLGDWLPMLAAIAVAFAAVMARLSISHRSRVPND